MEAKKLEAEYFIREGRRISYSIVGERGADLSVLYFHGFPGSRMEALRALKPAKELGIQFIAFDRPGLGGSDPSKGFRRDEVARDAASLLDHLEIKSCCVIGVSGGGPYATRFAQLFPERIKYLDLIGPMGSVNGIESLKGMAISNKSTILLAHYSPFIALIFGVLLAICAKLSPRFMAWWTSLGTSADDERLLKTPKFKWLLNINTEESFAQGISSVTKELMLLARPFNSEVTVPLHIWHGEYDRYVPITMANEYKKQNPEAVLNLIPERGHFMLLETFGFHLGEIKKRFFDSGKAPKA